MARLRLTHLGSRATALSAVGLALCLLSGCAVTDADLQRWEGTQRGPVKLVAVVTHDKYSIDLRANALLSLIRMPARSGTRVGIGLLTDRHKDENGDDVDGALVSINEEDRKKILAAATPELVKQITAPPPPRNPDGTLAPDPSIPYKDAAFALISNKPPLVTDPERAELVKALITWLNTDFQDRIENSSQQYGVEQIMRTLGADAAKGLPDLVKEETTRVDRVISLVNDIGDAETKKKTAAALVKLAQQLESPEWNAAQKKIVEEHNAKSNTKATPEQVQGQIDKIRERRFTEEIFPSMKKIGQDRQIVDALLAYASNSKLPEDRRKLALAALEGHADKTVTSDGDKLFAIAKDDQTPDSVRDLAFTRLGELPKEQVLPKVYTLFESSKWKVRWVAASMVLKMIEPKDLPTFFSKLPSTNRVKQGFTESLSYGELITKLDPNGKPKPKDVVVSELRSKSFGAKMTAIGFFYKGSKADEGLLTPLAADKDTVPVCDKEDECLWQCDVPKAGNAKETETREVKTVGEVVTYCILPTLK